METYSLIALVFVVLILISALLAFRRHNRKQHKEKLDRAIEEGNLYQIELVRVQNPSSQDKKSYDLIEAERKKVWTSLSLKTSLAPKEIWRMSLVLIKEIAAIYHPEAENPQFQASIDDLLELNERIVKRLQEYIEKPPLNTIKDLNIQDVLNYKTRYENLSQSAGVKFAQKHKHLYSIGKHAWTMRNFLNPWYWGRKVVFTAGKEGLYRRLLSVVLKVVGEEAVLVYSERYTRNEAVVFEKNIALEMINMAFVEDVVSSEEYEVVLNFILNNTKFDDWIKVTLLKTLQRKRPVKTAFSLDAYNDKEKKRLLAEVERVAKADKLETLKKREALKALEDSLKPNSRHREK
ncbi:MAG: hypothetical protein U9N83_20735 [Thermodesulfobacteriota bacterium]|nr:hypothetical protein [Thermodesulfobacteriota bacterium]